MSKYFRWTLNILLIMFFSAFFLQRIVLITADLGRHITNGRMLMEEGNIVSTNFYSYTEPDFPTVNHHWLSGVIFFLIQKYTGFTALSLLYALMSGVTVFLFYKSAEKLSSSKIALLTTLIALPLMVNRKEIRPEGFSYLFLSLYLLLFLKYVQGEITFKKLLYVLIPVQIFWVNLHIFFVMGIMISGAFLTQEFFGKYFFKKKGRFKETVILSISLTLASLINPYGLKGLLEPFNIFKEYGYLIIENQSVFLVQKLLPSTLYFHFEILALLFIFMIISFAFSKKIRQHIALLLLTLVFTVYGISGIRGIPLFGMFFAVFLSSYIKLFWPIKEKTLYVLSAVLVVLYLIPNQYFSMIKPNSGAGLVKNINASGDFFRENEIKGPIFNNYDIGGYLIYHLYGKEKVFVDNRPEAYSVEFFKETYVPMQESEEKWQEMLEKYNFNAIFFFRRDYTPWAQPFLIRRLQDPLWKPVFVDDSTLILLKNSDQNKELLEKYELPKEMFSFTRT